MLAHRVFLELCVACVVHGLAACLVLADVCHVDNGHTGQKVGISQQLLLVGGQRNGTRAKTLLQRCQDLLKDLHLCAQRLVGTHCLGGALNAALHHFHVGKNELHVDGLQVTHGVNAALYVDNVVIFKATNDVQNCITLANVGKELVAQTLALGCALDKTCNVHELANGRGQLFGLVHFRQHVQTLVRNGHYTYVRLNGAEGVVSGFRACVGQRVEQSGFADVGQTDDTKLHNFYLRIP